MAFSMLPLLRRLPRYQLRDYLASLDPSLRQLVPWRLPDRVRVPMLRDAIDALPEAQRGRIHDDFEHVSHLASDFGQLRLHEALHGRPDLRAKLAKLEGAESRALCALMECQSEATEAAARAYLAKLQYGRNWSRFRAIGGMPLDTDDQQIAALGRRLRECFARLDGTGKHVFFELPSQIGEPQADGATLPTLFTAYVDKLPENEIELQDGNPQPRSLRLARTIWIAFDPLDSTIEVFSHGGGKHRREIAEIFAAEMLGTTQLEAWNRSAFDLERLRRRFEFETDPADEIAEVAVILLRLDEPGPGLVRVTLENGPDVDIYAASRRLFGAGDPLTRAGWSITKAKLRVTFNPGPSERRGKAITIELSLPNWSNLKEQTSRHQLLSNKYLRRWGLLA
jgi:hypothetical protein